MSEFNFKSQVCTSIEQSRRLLELGLKKETADMCYSLDSVMTHPFIPSAIFRCVMDTDVENKRTLPAWSLHRLIEMMPTMIKRWNQEWELSINNAGVIYFRKDTTAIIEALADNVFDNIVSTIKWLIKEGYFPKEYLV